MVVDASLHITKTLRHHYAGNVWKAIRGMPASPVLRINTFGAQNAQLVKVKERSVRYSKPYLLDILSQTCVRSFYGVGAVGVSSLMVAASVFSWHPNITVLNITNPTIIIIASERPRSTTRFHGIVRSVGCVIRMVFA